MSKRLKTNCGTLLYRISQSIKLQQLRECDASLGTDKLSNSSQQSPQLLLTNGTGWVALCTEQIKLELDLSP